MTDKMQEVPRSVDKERALLGAIMIDPSIINQVSITGGMFYSEAHQAIFKAMRALGANDMNILSLGETLDRKGKLSEIGGELYLLELQRDCPAAYSWESWERIIYDTYIRRRLIEQAGELATKAMNLNENIDGTVAEVTSKIAMTAEALKGTKPIKESIGALYGTVENRAADPKTIFGLETGIKDFDAITQGLQKRETMILAGVPGCGKSILAFQIACGMAERGHPGAVFELEMSTEAVLRRKLSGYSNIPAEHMRTGRGMNDSWGAFTKAIEKMEALPIYISDDSGWNPITVRAELAKQKIVNNIEWFVIDYMDLLQAPGFDSYERSEYLSQQLHGIAKDLDLAGLIIHSLNKTGYTSAGMHTLSGSSKVSYDADQIVVIKPDPDTFGLVTLKWEKMREGINHNTLQMIIKAGVPEFNPVTHDTGEMYLDYTDI